MKKIAVILVFLLLIQAVPIDTFNYGESTMTINKLVSMSVAELSALTDKQIFEAITSSINYPPDTDGTLSYDGRTRKERVDLNISSFRKYRQIIYGVPFDKQSDYGGKVLDKSEPKYLGFNKSGDPMTNDKYPGANLGEEPPNKKWIVRSNQHADSWRPFNDSSDDKTELFNHMLKTDTINSDAVGRYTLEEILQKTDGMSNLSSLIGSNNETLRQKLSSVAKLQSLPTFFSQGSFVMKHIHNKTEYYDTMEWDRIKSFKGSLTIEPEKKYILMLPEDDEVTNKFKVTFHYDDKISGGMDTEKLLPNEIELNLSTQVEFVDKRNPTYTFSKTYKRSELANGKINRKKEEASTSFDTLVGDEFGFKNSTEFEIDVKMKGPISVDFTVNHDAMVYEDNEMIILDEGMWDSSDDLVTIDLKDETILSPSLLDDIPDLKIVSWNWYIKKTSGEFELIGDPLVNKNMTYTLPFGTDYSWNIPNPDKENRIESEIFLKLEAMDSEGNKGEKIHNVKIANKLEDDDNPTSDPTPNEPPKARIKIKEEIKAGAKSKATSRSTDEDGSIVDYDWDIWNAYYYKGRHDKRTYFYILDVNDSARAELEVTDDDGASDDTWTRFAIVNPLTPVIETYGALKENRKVNISSGMSTGTKYFPIQWDRTEWKITPLDGQSSESIKIDGELLGKDKDVLFKEPGQYKVWMKLYTTCTYKDEEDITYDAEIEKIITIKPDEKPIADLSLRKMVYRNPDTDGVAVLNMADNSSSIDGDFIAHRKWSYTFDSDNDGSFDDEVAKVASDENEVMVQINVDKVGNYLITLEVTEEFGQPTIEKFVKASDRRKDDNTDIEEEKRTSEVLNVAPTVELNFDERKQVDLILLTDYEGQALMDLRDQVESLKMRLQEQKVDAEIYVFDNTLPENKESIGKLNDAIYKFYKKALLSYKWAEVKHYENHRYKYSNYNVIVNANSMIIESLTCRMSEIQSHQEDKGYYGEVVEGKHFDKGNGNYIKYFIRIYNNLGNLIKEFEHDMETYNGGKRSMTYFDKDYTTNTKHMNFEVQNKFYPYEKVSDNWGDYIALKTDNLKNISLRENSDKYLIMSVKNRNSLGLLDEDVNSFIEENKIITRASLNEIYREFYAKYYDFVDIEITDKAVYVQTPYGTNLKIGDSEGDESYLDFTKEKIKFSGDRKEQLDKKIGISSIPTYSGSYSHGKYGVETDNFPDAYGNLTFSDNKIAFSYRFPGNIYNDDNVNGYYSRKKEPISNNAEDIYVLENNSFVYKETDGSWIYGNIMNDGSGHYDFKSYNKWKGYIDVNNLYQGVFTSELDIDRVKSISKRHILGENGNLYFFDKKYKYYNYNKFEYTDRRVNFVSNNVKKAYVAGNKAIYLKNDDEDQLYEVGIGNNYSFVRKKIYEGRNVDKIRSNNDTTVVLFDDNTLIGVGNSDYCQLKTKAKSKSYTGLYDSPILLDTKYLGNKFISPMDIVTSNV
ncbi:MAG: hypothetical protein N4A40_02970 [Tissierellales bacterium]|nr:hypothetical protein [Tissierellales bacterium]